MTKLQMQSIASLLIIVIGLVLIWIGTRPITNQPIEATSSTTLTTGTSAVVGVEGEQVLVTEVIDGDTIKISAPKGRDLASGGEGIITVRFLGIDTPETKDPRKSVQCFGKEASNEAKKLLSGKLVILEKDVSETDKYKRLLRYVFLPLEDGRLLFVNDYLIREGFARVLTYPPDVKYTEQFLKAQREAKEGKKGLWSKC